MAISQPFHGWMHHAASCRYDLASSVMPLLRPWMEEHRGIDVKEHSPSQVPSIPSSTHALAPSPLLSSNPLASLHVLIMRAAWSAGCAAIHQERGLSEGCGWAEAGNILRIRRPHLPLPWCVQCAAAMHPPIAPSGVGGDGSSSHQLPPSSVQATRARSCMRCGMGSVRRAFRMWLCGRRITPMPRRLCALRWRTTW